MPSAYTPPAISVAFDMDSDAHILMATSHGRADVAGPRILRAPPHPDVKWRHATQEAAEADVAKLNAYFAGLGKGPSKTALRKQGL